MDTVLHLIMISAVLMFGAATILFVSFLLLLLLGRTLHPSSHSPIAKLMNWAAYFDRRNTRIVFRPASKGKLVAAETEFREVSPSRYHRRATEGDSAISRMTWVEVDLQDWVQREEPFRGTNPDNSDYVRETVNKLQSLGIGISDDPKNLEIAATHRVQGWILNPLLPDRILVFDREMISSGKDYGVLLNSFARISAGEWLPRNVRAAVDFQRNRAFVEFDYEGERHLWEFEHHFDWVSVEFDELIKDFANAHLAGTYIHLSAESQESAVLYLPKVAANEFRRFFARK